MTDTPTPDLTAPEQVDRLADSYVIPGMPEDCRPVITAATLRALSAKLKAAEAERDAALEALEPFSIMAGVLFAMNYELSDDVFSIKAKHGEVVLTFEAFLNARKAARTKGGE